MFSQVRPSGGPQCSSVVDCTPARPSPPSIDRLQLEVAELRRTVASSATERDALKRLNSEVTTRQVHEKAKEVSVLSSDLAVNKEHLADVQKEAAQVAVAEDAMKTHSADAAAVVAQWEKVANDATRDAAKFP